MLTGNSLVDPKRHTLQDRTADFVTHHGGGEELPIGLGVQMSAVEREAVALTHDVIPVALHLVNALRHEAGLVAVVVTVAWFHRFLAVAGDAGSEGICICEGWFVEVEAEEGVGVEVVERCPGAVPVVGKFGVGAVAGDAEFFPFGDVGVGYVLEWGLIFGCASNGEGLTL